VLCMRYRGFGNYCRKGDWNRKTEAKGQKACFPGKRAKSRVVEERVELEQKQRRDETERLQ
jgi:hypothetical protein